MEEINLKDLFAYFLSKIVIIIIIFIIAVSGSIAYSEFLKKPRYNSYTTVVLATSNDDKKESSITQADITINQKLVSTYRQIIKSRKVLGQVIDNLELNMTVSELSQNISVTNETDTELIRITVSSLDKEQAALVANEIAKVFSEEIVNIYNIKNVSIIDQAIVSNVPYNINVIKDAIIYGLVGIVVGLGIVFIMFYFDTTIKNPEEIQEKLGLPLLGVVPKFESSKSKHKKKIEEGE